MQCFELHKKTCLLDKDYITETGPKKFKCTLNKFLVVEGDLQISKRTKKIEELIQPWLSFDFYFQQFNAYAQLHVQKLEFSKVKISI